MGKNNKTITIYWSPGTFDREEESWEMFYSDPKKVISQFNGHTKIKKEPNTSKPIFTCPATKDLVNNLFYFDYPMNADLNFDLVNNYSNSNKIYPYLINAEGLGLSLSTPRPTSLEGYFPLTYNMSWLLFADEPLVARFTPPYFPFYSPMEGAVLASGEFDIGQWFRPFHLDYHVPITTTSFKLTSNDPLFYIELKTDKEVVFKRYRLTKELAALGRECVQSPKLFGPFKKLQERYDFAQKSKMKERVLAEIKENLY